MGHATGEATHRFQLLRLDEGGLRGVPLGEGGRDAFLQQIVDPFEILLGSP